MTHCSFTIYVNSRVTSSGFSSANIILPRFSCFFEMCWHEKPEKLVEKTVFELKTTQKSNLGEMIFFDEKETFSMSFGFLGVQHQKTKDPLEETKKTKTTKAKPKIQLFWLKPSFLCQKIVLCFLVLPVVFCCFSVEDLTEATICKSYCIFLLKTVSLWKDNILSRKTAYLKGKKGLFLNFILLKEVMFEGDTV